MPIGLRDIPELSPNLQALPYVNQLIEYSKRLKIEVKKVGRTTVIDCGVNAVGGYEAGILFARICLGGLAKVRVGTADFSGWCYPSVEVLTDHPVMACMASQYAGWYIKKDKFTAMGSGPARSVILAEELFSELGYKDSAETAVLCLESRKLPEEEVVKWIVEKCGCKEENVYLLVAPTASIVGSVQIAARSIETGLHKLMELGYDLGRVESAWGAAFLPPVAKDDLSALGRTNDAVLYGATVHYVLQDDDNVLQSLVSRIPSCSSKDYGISFQELFKRYGNFYDIDPLLFSPARVCLHNKKSGRLFCCGEIRPDLLRKSFGLE